MAAPAEVFQFIANHEGGLTYDSNNKVIANRGVTRTAFDAYASSLGIPDDDADFNTLLTDEQLQAFINQYWLMGGFSRLANQGIADFLFDWYWRAPKWSARFISQYLNSTFAYNLDTTVTGMTPAIIDAINDVENKQAVYDAIKQAQAAQFQAYITNFPAQAANLNGWTNRLNDGYNTFQSYLGTTLNSNAPAPGNAGGAPSFDFKLFSTTDDLDAGLLPSWLPEPVAIGLTAAALLFIGWRWYEYRQQHKTKTTEWTYSPT